MHSQLRLSMTGMMLEIGKCTLRHPNISFNLSSWKLAELCRLPLRSGQSVHH